VAGRLIRITTALAVAFVAAVAALPCHWFAHVNCGNLTDLYTASLYCAPPQPSADVIRRGLGPREPPV